MLGAPNWRKDRRGQLCKALFACLIIRIFQLVFSAGTVFFSHNKSAETMFRFVLSAKRTGQKYIYGALIASHCKVSIYIFAVAGAHILASVYRGFHRIARSPPPPTNVSQ